MPKQLAIALLLLAGCGAFAAAADGPAPPPAEDGGATETDAAAESSAGPDAEPDGAKADAGSEAGCRQVFEERFTVDPLGTSWKTEFNGGGSLSFLANGGEDGGGALRAAVAANAAYGVARAQRVFPPPFPRRATLSFAMKVASHATDAFYLPGCNLMAWTTNDTFFMVTPAISSGSLRVQASSRKDGDVAPDVTGAVGAVQIGRWYSFRLQLDELSPKGARAILEVDGSTLVNQTFSFPETAGELRVRCGVDYIDDNKQTDVHVDDVVYAVCD